MVGASEPYGLAKVHIDGRVVLKVFGEIDIATVDEIAAAVREELGSGPVSLDLSELSFMDSSGLRMLLDLLRESERAGWSLTIGHDLHRNVRRLLDMAGLLDVLPFDCGGAQQQRG